MICKNHPERETKRRCYTCKDGICADCTRRKDGHYFCSDDCHGKWLAAPQAAPKRKTSRRAKKQNGRKTSNSAPAIRAAANKSESEPASGLPNAVSPAVAPSHVEASRTAAPLIFRQSTEPPVSRRWLAALAAGNAVIVALLSFLIWRSAEPREQQSGDGWSYLGDLNRILKAAAFPGAAPMLGESPMETTAATFAIDGLAGGAKSVILYLNGKDMGQLAITGDTFTSPALALEYGLNVIQVAADDGESEIRYSLAKLIRRIDVPPVVHEAAIRLNLSLPSPQDIVRGNPERNEVSFTFDGGSEANAAEDILAILRASGVKTTLFLTGQFIRRNPEVVRQAIRDGHEVANHTFSHPHLTTYEVNSRQDMAPGVTRDSFRKQLLDTAAEFRALTGRDMAPFWRAPFGEQNPQLRTWASELGFRHVGWTPHVGKAGSLDSLDWVDDKDSRLYMSGAELKARFVNLVQAESNAVRGGIFLMHLGTDRKTDKMHAQLADILTAYKKRGFSVVPVSQLIR